jgi:nucleotide-binding universal stress UspA family protein
MMPPPRTPGFRSILCAVDFSRYSAKALRYAAALAASCGGRVTAIYALDPLLTAAAAAAYDSHVLERTALTDLKRFVRTSVHGDRAAGIGCIVAVGPAGAVVLAHARHARSGLIVMGTHGRRGVRKLFFGSTTEAVLRRFRGPVLAIPPRCREPRPGWPGGYIVAAVEDGAHRRALLSSAARMAEAFGAWLALAPVVPRPQRAARHDAQMIIFPLPQAAHFRMLRQGSAAYRFVCGARRPVLVMPTGTRPGPTASPALCSRRGSRPARTMPRVPLPLSRPRTARSPSA